MKNIIWSVAAGGDAYTRLNCINSYEIPHAGRSSARVSSYGSPATLTYLIRRCSGGRAEAQTAIIAKIATDGLTIGGRGLQMGKPLVLVFSRSREFSGTGNASQRPTRMPPCPISSQ